MNIVLHTGSVPTYLVSEDLDFAVSSVHWLCIVCLQSLIRIHHRVQWVALHPLLGGELSTQAVDTQDKLGGGGGGGGGRGGKGGEGE